MKFATIFFDKDRNPVDDPKKAHSHIRVVADPEHTKWYGRTLYDPDKHGKTLFCGHLKCAQEGVRVYHAQPKSKKNVSVGGNLRAKARFGSWPGHGDAHHKNCNMQRAYPEFEKKSAISKDDALERDLPILLLLTQDVGDPDYGMYGTIFEWLKSSGRLKQWSDMYEHGTIKIDDLDMLFNTLSDLAESRTHAFNKVVIGHCEEIIPANDFLIGANKEKTVELFRALANTPDLDQNKAPHWVQIRSTQLELQNQFSQSLEVRGKPIVYRKEQGKTLSIENVVLFDSAALRSKFLSYARQDMTAIAKVNEGQLKTAREHFENGNSATYKIYWRVKSEDQFRPSKEAIKMKEELQERIRKQGIQYDLFTQPAVPYAS